jgi:esterase/lipase superfamily enzyme
MVSLKSLQKRVRTGEALDTDQLSKFNALTTLQIRNLLKNGKVKIAESARQYLIQVLDNRQISSNMQKWKRTAKQKSLWFKFEESCNWRVYKK